MIFLNKIIKNVFLMRFGKIFLWFCFLFLFYLIIDNFYYMIETYMHIKHQLYWYDFMTYFIFIILFLYGVYIYDKIKI